MYMSISISYYFNIKDFTLEFSNRLMDKFDEQEFFGPSCNLAEKNDRIRRCLINDLINEGYNNIAYLVQKNPRKAIGFYVSVIADKNNPLVFSNNTKKLLSIYAYNTDIQLKNQPYIKKFRENMLELLPVIKPEYVWSDDGKITIARERKDPRQFIWGVNYWEKELAEKIGIDKIKQLDGDKWKVTEPSIGGIILYGLPNSYMIKQEEKDRVAEFLQITDKLKDILKPDTQESKNLVKKVKKNYW
jgi:hypothetical protein